MHALLNSSAISARAAVLRRLRPIVSPVAYDRVVFMYWSVANRLDKDNDLSFRRDLANAIARARRPDGTMVLTESGQDCDGVRYSGRLWRGVPATLRGFADAESEALDYADGMFSLWPVPADVDPESISYASRDLVAEAFEDGHPSVIRP